MMLKNFKVPIHWLHLLFFKPYTFNEDVGKQTGIKDIEVWFKVLAIGLAIILSLEIAIGSLCQFAGYPFSWSAALKETFKWWLLFGLIPGLIWGVVGMFALSEDKGLIGGLVDGLVWGLGVGLAYGLVGGVISGLIGGLGVGIGTSVTFGLAFGMSTGLFAGMIVLPGGYLLFRIVSALIVSAAITLPGWLIFNLLTGTESEQIQWPSFEIGYFSAFLFAYLRPFYLLPQIFQYWRAKVARNPFKTFRSSPVYWDEAVALPLPFLADWLVRLANHDRERGLAEISFVEEERPWQQRAARKAMRILVTQQVEQVANLLQQVNSPEEMAKAAETLKSLPSDSEYLPGGLGDVQRRIGTISTLARDYLTRATSVGQSNVLREMRRELESFRDAMTLVEPPVGSSFRTVDSRWLEIVARAEAESRERLAFSPIPNPFIAGNPLQQRDHDLFKGRKDIIVAIEKNIINTGQRPALLLYGRRRTGKSSTLLNLPRLLSSQFTSVYIDCQDAKWRDGNVMFCYNLAAAIYGELYQRNLHDGLARPSLEQFEKYAFTKLDEYLDEVEQLSRRINKRILLTFDEYERMEQGIKEARITEEVFNKIRNIVQHRERIVVLFSGSHWLDELKTVRWSDYLINVKTLELSYLAAADARELITRPVAGFNLQYDPGVAERILELTHCQPYLLQALASDLVDYLNEENRTMATQADLEIAIEETLVSAQYYFANIWDEECSEAERDVLLAMAADEEKSFRPMQPALQSLSRKEIVEKSGDRYRIAVELFRRWIVKEQLATETPDEFDPLRELAELRTA
jgi:hypothetical protein